MLQLSLLLLYWVFPTIRWLRGGPTPALESLW